MTSGKPAFLSDSGELRWEAKYATDAWGATLYRDVQMAAVTGSDGAILVPARTERQPVLNPDWDPSLAYVPRMQRPEWVAVGMLGKLLVRDDGSCAAGGFASRTRTESRRHPKWAITRRNGPASIKC